MIDTLIVLCYYITIEQRIYLKQEVSMKVIKVEYLFGENDYRCGRMAPYVITKDGINYLSLDAVKALGFIYETKEIEEVEI